MRGDDGARVLLEASTVVVTKFVVVYNQIMGIEDTSPLFLVGTDMVEHRVLA